MKFHQVGADDANLAIVSLDPGIPGSTRGRVVIRNFSARPHAAELALDLGDSEQFHQTMMLAPREQVIAAFGPLKTGGLLQARILTPDAIAADNSRYAYAPFDLAARVLVLSPDAAVRDDLARVLLAVNANFQIETADPAKYVAPSGGECAAARTGSDARLLSARGQGGVHAAYLSAASREERRVGISVDGTIASADIRDDAMGESPALNL